MGSFLFPQKLYSTKAAQPGLGNQAANPAGIECAAQMRAAGYLNAVHLLGQDSEKVIRKVAQQGWVPVPVATLACRLSRA